MGQRAARVSFLPSPNLSSSRRTPGGEGNSILSTRRQLQNSCNWRTRQARPSRKTQDLRGYGRVALVATDATTSTRNKFDQAQQLRVRSWRRADGAATLHTHRNSYPLPHRSRRIRMEAHWCSVAQAMMWSPSEISPSSRRNISSPSVSRRKIPSTYHQTRAPSGTFAGLTATA